MNTVMSGAAVTQVRDGIYLVDVVMRATDEQRVSLSTLRNCSFRFRTAARSRSSQFATLDFEQEFPADLAPRPRSDPDRPGRRGAGRLAGSGGRGACSRGCEAECEPADRPITSPWAARSRKARSRRPPCIAVVPLMLLIMLTVLMIQLQSFSACSSS